jgi:transcription elongation factor/antiterminator RfaH
MDMAMGMGMAKRKKSNSFFRTMYLSHPNIISNQSDYQNKPVHQWYAVYTRPHHEKKVHQQLQSQQIECYLPIQTTLRQWSDRKKKVAIPLFSCYVFVYVNKRQYYNVVNTPGIVRYVSFEGKAAPIPEKQIQLIKNILDEGNLIDVCDLHLKSGEKVRIMSGPLTGIEGDLIEFSGKKRVLIDIHEISKNLIVNIPLHKLYRAG